MKRDGLKQGIRILPNLLTTANMFCGFFAIIQVLNENFILASWVLFLGGIFDFLDGRVARLTRTESEFGLEYDSLSDLTSFCLAPALLMYHWTLHEFGHLGWAVAFLFFACGALRLARFNVQAATVEKKHFQGLPTPPAAACPVSYVILHHHLFGEGVTKSYLILFLMTIVALLMVSNISYRSLKVIDMRSKANFFFLVIVIGTVVVIAAAPQVMLFVVAIAYASSGVLIELSRSGRRIRSFNDFLMRFFHAHSDELTLEERPNRKKSPLKMVSVAKSDQEGSQS